MEIGHVITILVSFIVAFLTLQNFLNRNGGEEKKEFTQKQLKNYKKYKISYLSAVLI